MKNNTYCISEKFYKSLVIRLTNSFSRDLAAQITMMVRAFANDEMATADFSRYSDEARTIFNFILHDLEKARTRSQRCREAAARRKAARENSAAVPPTEPAKEKAVTPATRQLSRRERRVLEKDERQGRHAYGPAPKSAEPEKTESAKPASVDYDDEPYVRIYNEYGGFYYGPRPKNPNYGK